MAFTVQDWVDGRGVGNESLFDPPTSYDTIAALLNAVRNAIALSGEGHFIIVEIKDGKFVIQERSVQ